MKKNFLHSLLYTLLIISIIILGLFLGFLIAIEPVIGIFLFALCLTAVFFYKKREAYIKNQTSAVPLKNVDKPIVALMGVVCGLIIFVVFFIVMGLLDSLNLPFKLGNSLGISFFFLMMWLSVKVLNKINSL